MLDTDDIDGCSEAIPDKDFMDVIRSAHFQRLSPNSTVEPLTPLLTPVHNRSSKVKQEDSPYPHTAHQSCSTPMTSSSVPCTAKISPSLLLESSNVSQTALRVTNIEAQLTTLSAKVSTAKDKYDSQLSFHHSLVERQHELKSSLKDAEQLRKTLLNQQKEIKNQITANRIDVAHLKEVIETRGEEIEDQQRANSLAGKMVAELKNKKLKLKDELAKAVCDRDIERQFKDEGVRTLARRLGWSKDEDDIDFVDRFEEGWITMVNRMVTGAKDIGIADFEMIEDGMQRMSADPSEDIGLSSASRTPSSSKAIDQAGEAVKIEVADGEESAPVADLTMEDIHTRFREFKDAKEHLINAMRIMKGTKRKQPAQDDDDDEESAGATPLLPAKRRLRPRSKISSQTLEEESEESEESGIESSDGEEEGDESGREEEQDESGADDEQDEDEDGSLDSD